MAITEKTIINNSIRNAASNAPSLGCGATYVASGTSLPAGDYVAVQGVGGTGLIVLTSVTYVDGRGGLYDITGALKASVTLAPTKGSNITYLPIKSCDVGTTDAIFYHRCK